MTLKHRKVTVIPDDAAYDVGSDEWNDDHVVNASNKQVLFADGATGIVAGDAGLTYDKTTDTLTIGQDLIVGDDCNVTDKCNLGNGGVDTGTLLFWNANHSFSTGFISSDSATGGVTYTLPTNMGAAGSVLRDSAGNGTLSWGTGGLANPYTQDSGSSAAIYFEYTQNTPAKGRWGVETGSGGAGIFTGATNNATVFGAVTNHNVEFFQNDTKRLTIGSAAITTTLPLTVTGLTTITQASANAGVLASTGYSLTGSDATGMVSLAGTWNTSGNPVMLKIAMTDTASGATTKFASFLAGAAGATEVFYVTKTGAVVSLVADSTPAFSIGGTSSSFPAFRKSGAIIDVVTADNSAFIPLRASALTTFSGRITGSSTGFDIGFTTTGVAEVNAASAGSYRDLIVRTLFSGPASANAQFLGIKNLTELLTIAAAVNSTTTIQKPADSIILAVSVRVTTAVTCTTGFTVGDSTGVTRFNVATLVSKAATTTDKGTKAGAYYNATAEGIIITPDTTPSDATGRVRVTIHYIEITPPTS